MTPFDRRELVKLFGASGAALFAGALPLFAEASQVRNINEAPTFNAYPFALGVASGEPAADGFVIWTRLVTRPLDPHGGIDRRPMSVRWEVASDERFMHVVRSGRTLAAPELAHAVHVEVDGLSPDRHYWYRFMIAGETSPVGRSRTTPTIGAPCDHARFVAAGCQAFSGHFTAWRHIAEEKLDFVFHYGDYIYETAGNATSNPAVPATGGRVIHGPELYSLDDYRVRYAEYKADPDLQAAHAAHPFFVSFDDHEVDNNWAAGLDENDTPPEVFAVRRAGAFQAYYENMPLRRSSLPGWDGMRMYRQAQYGDLLNAFVLDTRQYRSKLAYLGRASPLGPEVYDQTRTMLGDAQEAWLFDGLARSQTRWNLLAQQVLMMGILDRRPDDGVLVSSMDKWPAYMHSRRRLLDHIDRHCPGNVVSVTGDAHVHMAGDLLQDEGDGKVIASEFLATSITSGGDGTGDATPRVIDTMERHPELKAMTDQRGYLLCDLTHERWQGDLMVVDKVRQAGGALSRYARFVTEPGRPGLTAA